MGSALSTLALPYSNVPRERGIESARGGGVKLILHIRIEKNSGRITPSIVVSTQIFDTSLVCLTALQLVSRRAGVFTTSVGCHEQETNQCRRPNKPVPFARVVIKFGISYFADALAASGRKFKPSRLTHAVGDVDAVALLLCWGRSNATIVARGEASIGSLRVRYCRKLLATKEEARLEIITLIIPLDMTVIAIKCAKL
ncbi:hypothetical protein BDN71DRAFT_1496356 [Pleurotus eryngii]|uniref:Uncharacterized protein n=1 Tax=Pleurotus eryngii TaxID=5323 RepID=A0A9P5ZVH1_PLEER|nr:hypothetical protein BDN71DRAFT_1496356 [Pleurotus eryngii]